MVLIPDYAPNFTMSYIFYLTCGLGQASIFSNFRKPSRFPILNQQLETLAPAAFKSSLLKVALTRVCC